MKTIYECSQSKGIKWVTLIFFIIITLAILVEIYYVSKGINVTVAIIVTAILLAASFSCFLIFPMYIIADDEGIGIRTMMRTKRISYESIDHIERVDDQFTRRMFRILLTLQHNMAGLNRKSKDELTIYYSKLINLLADESSEWIKTL